MELWSLVYLQIYTFPGEKLAVQYCLQKKRWIAVVLVESNEVAQEAALVAARTSSLCKTEMGEVRTAPWRKGILVLLYCTPLTVGQHRQHLWPWVSWAACQPLLSIHKMKFLGMCSAVVQALLGRLQVSDHLAAHTVVLTNQISSERKQGTQSKINKSNEVSLLPPCFFLSFSLAASFKQSQVKWFQAPVSQKRCLGFIELAFVSLLCSVQGQATNRKRNRQSSPKMTSWNNDFLPPESKERAWTDRHGQEMCSSKTLPQWVDAKDNRSGSFTQAFKNCRH